jgi:hypothetical protein
MDSQTGRRNITGDKQKLSTDVIGESSGEGWVTEMSNSELLNLLRLEV